MWLRSFDRAVSMAVRADSRVVTGAWSTWSTSAACISYVMSVAGKRVTSASREVVLWQRSVERERGETTCTWWGVKRNYRGKGLGIVRHRKLRSVHP